MQGKQWKLGSATIGVSAVVVMGALGIFGDVSSAEPEQVAGPVVPLYTGQKSYLEILGELRARGFNAAYFSSVHSRRRHGEEWEYNVFCVRNLPGAAEPRADRA